MIAIRLWNYFSGYVIIKIEGLTLERFINLATVKNIYLWDIIRYDYTTLEAKVSIKGFKELKEIVLKAGCRVNIISKKGFPFMLNKFKYRKMLGLGFVIMVGVIFFLTSFIWSIDIIGDKGVDQEKLLEYLNKRQVTIGVKKSTIEKEELKIDILKKFDDIAYVDIDIEGTKLIVEAKIRNYYDEKDIINKNEPCNIVADKKAIIEKIVAKNGTALVEKGDIVKKGQILISGEIKNDLEENILLVHSEGDIFARTYYMKAVKEPIIKIEKEKTGNIYYSREIKIGDKSIHLKKNDIPFKDYVEEMKDEGNKVTSLIPIDVITHEYKEVINKEIKQNVDSLKKIMSVKITKDIMKELKEDAKVESKDIEHTVDENYLITRVRVEVIEKIGVKKYINKNITN